MAKDAPQKSSFEDPNLDLWILLDHARFAISRARELELAQFGVTPEQTAILHTLIIRGGSATMEEIANTTMRQHHSVSTLINRMIKQNLVRREKLRTPKVKYQIYISEQGELTYNESTRLSINMSFDILTKNEKKVLSNILNKLIVNGRSLMGIDKKLPFLK